MRNRYASPPEMEHILLPIMEQQQFIHEAMRQLDLSREALSSRLGVKTRRLDSWLLPSSCAGSRHLPTLARKFLIEMLDNASLSAGKSPQKSDFSLAGRLGVNGKPHLISSSQIDKESLRELFRIADILQPVARRRKSTRILEGAVLGNLFFEPSTRTRVSFAAAFNRLGGSVCGTTGLSSSSIAKGESIYDTGRVLSGYVDILVVRHPEIESIDEFAQATGIPLINAGNGSKEHPTQALLDVYTIQQEFSRLGREIDGSHIAIVGDLKYGRTVHSLASLLSLYRSIRFTLIAPPLLGMPEDLVELMVSRGHVVEQSEHLDALHRPDLVYATRVQKERFEGSHVAPYADDFQINKKTIDSFCRPDTVIMHPLPRDGRPGANDLNVDLNNDPRLAIFRQTDNGISIRMALFAVFLRVERQLERSLRDVSWNCMPG